MTKGRAAASGKSEETAWIPVGGASMWPTLRDGDRVVVSPGEPLQFGDIAAFVGRDRKLVVHRYVGRRKGSQRFLGDACSDMDRPVEPDAVLGRVTRYERDGTSHSMVTTWGDRVRLGRRVAMLVGSRLRRRWQ